MSASTSFTATVSAITDAFGDPTRRRVYLLVREAGTDGLTTSAVAEQVGVHPNVARHHLEKLSAGGYLEVSTARLDGGGAGRPSKRYRAVADRLTEFPVRSDDLVLSLLGRALDRLPADEAERLAEEVGTEYGRAMAVGLNGEALEQGHRSLRAAIQSVADALTAHGFAAHAESRNDGLRIINTHCPFGDVATDHPVICAVDRGMVRGMLGALYDAEIGDVVTEASVARGDTFCSTSV
ncbi:MAG: helix-turn-helix domain-containing protein [Ilumatobacter sp.]|jgi:predicted ArsR family transcriptional regulator|nr:hypothetical protein [Actinomycetota bacterium]